MKRHNFFIDALDALVTAIFLHYLVMGFSDIVWSINSFLMWLKEIGVIK